MAMIFNHQTTVKELGGRVVGIIRREQSAMTGYERVKMIYFAFRRHGMAMLWWWRVE